MNVGRWWRRQGRREEVRPLWVGPSVASPHSPKAASTLHLPALFFCFSASPLAPGRLWKYNTDGVGKVVGGWPTRTAAWW